MAEAVVEHRRLNRNSPVPLYYQLLEALQDLIDSRPWGPEETLPSEAELCEQFGVSRTVVRQALDSLERTGAIHRIKGKGAFVSNRRIMAYLLQNPHGFYDNLTAQGLIIETRVLSYEELPASTRIAEALHLEVGAPVIRMERLRLVDGVAIFLARTFVPSHLVEGLTAEEFSTRALTEILQERHGLYPTGGKRVVEAIVTGRREAELLEVPMGAPLLRLLAVTTAQDGTPMEASQVWLRGDRIGFEVYLG